MLNSSTDVLQMCSPTYLNQGYFQALLSFWKSYASSTTSTYWNSWRKTQDVSTKTEKNNERERKKKKRQIRNRKTLVEVVTAEVVAEWERERTRERGSGGVRAFEYTASVYLGCWAGWSVVTSHTLTHTQWQQWVTGAGIVSVCQLKSMQQVSPMCVSMCACVCVWLHLTADFTPLKTNSPTLPCCRKRWIKHDPQWPPL